MFSTESVSKGCFVFKPTGSKKLKPKENDPLELISSEAWYSAYSQLWKNIEKKLENLEDDLTKKLLNNIVEFITDSSSDSGTIPTATLLTGINLPDHGSLFAKLSVRLRDNVTNHIALLKASECPSLKNMIEQMTGQFMNKIICPDLKKDDIADLESDDDDEVAQPSLRKNQCSMPVLLDWYNQSVPSPSKRSKPGFNSKLVVVVPEFETFPTKVLHDFILILSGYATRLPFVLVLGVATTVSALNNSLPHKITSKLAIQLFLSQPSIYFLNNTLDKVFLSYNCPFQLGPKIFKFLTDVFLFYDFSVNGFTQGIKYCVMEHFYEKPVNVLCCDVKKLKKRVHELTKDQIEGIYELLSFRKYVESQPKPVQILLLTDENHLKETVLKLLKNLHQSIFQFHTSLRLLKIIVSQLPHASLGKQIRDYYCAAMSSKISETLEYKSCVQLLEFISKEELLAKLNKMFEYLTVIDKVSKRSNSWVETLKEKLIYFKSNLENPSVNQKTQSPIKSPSKIDMHVKNRTQLKEKLAELGKCNKTVNNRESPKKEALNYFMTELFPVTLAPLTLHPLHEIMVCDNVTSVKRRIIGTPRAATHTALNNPQQYLQCDCCILDNTEEIMASMPDICIVYKLHLECGSLINMYDWLLAFVTVVHPEFSGDTKHIDPQIQARFTQAVAELEFLGFVKSSTRKIDHVARLTWGGTS